MSAKLIFIVFITLALGCKDIDFEKNKSIYLQEQLELATPVWKHINATKYSLNSMNQNDFTRKVDSFQTIFTDYLIINKNNIDRNTFNEETVLIKLAFDKLVLEYPELHKRYTGGDIVLSEDNHTKLNENIKFFNDEAFFSTRELQDYLTSFIRIESNIKLESSVFAGLDNQQLNSDWSVMDEIFTNSKFSDFWKYKYLEHHIDNLGIKSASWFFVSQKPPSSRNSLGIFVQQKTHNFRCGFPFAESKGLFSMIPDRYPVQA